MPITINALDTTKITKEFQDTILTNDYVSEYAKSNSIPCANSQGVLDSSWYGSSIPIHDLLLKAQDLGSVSGTKEIDFDSGSVVKMDISSDTVLKFITSRNVMEAILVIDCSSSATITWTGVTFPIGNVPTMNGVEIIRIFTTDAGLTWYGYQLTDITGGSVYNRTDITTYDLSESIVLDNSIWPSDADTISVFLDGELLPISYYTIDDAAKTLTFNLPNNYFSSDQFTISVVNNETNYINTLTTYDISSDISLDASAWAADITNMDVYLNSKLISSDYYTLDPTAKTLTFNVNNIPSTYYASKSSAKSYVVTVVAGEAQYPSEDTTDEIKSFKTIRTDKELATGTTSITLTRDEYPSGTSILTLYINGILLALNIDYTLSNRTITFTEESEEGDVLSVVAGYCNGYSIADTLESKVDTFLQNPIAKCKEITNAYTTCNLDFSIATMFDVSIIDATAFTFSNIDNVILFDPTGITLTILLKNSGKYSVSFPSGVKFVEGSSFDGTCIITLKSFDSGSTWFGTVDSYTTV